uniref:Uncharacterized protein n=1 Tax=Anguilla anguilla TaxID=7936 RepID=A0A0E9UIU2_ANGAN
MIFTSVLFFSLCVVLL